MERRAPCPGQLGGMQSQFINGYTLYCLWSNHERSKTSLICTLEEQKLSTITGISVRREMHGARRKGANEKRRGTRRKLWERLIFRGQAEKEEPAKIWFLPIMSEKEKLVSSFPHEDIGYLTCLWNPVCRSRSISISNLRYAHDTTLVAESEEELKSLLVKVKEDWKRWLKTRHSKTKGHGIRSHHFMANRSGKSGNWQISFSWAPKSLWMVTQAMKWKNTCFLEGNLWQT